MLYREKPAQPTRMLLRVVADTGLGVLMGAAACGGESSGHEINGTIQNQGSDSGATEGGSSGSVSGGVPSAEASGYPFNGSVPNIPADSGFELNGSASGVYEVAGSSGASAESGFDYVGSTGAPSGSGFVTGIVINPDASVITGVVIAPSDASADASTDVPIFFGDAGGIIDAGPWIEDATDSNEDQ